MIGEFSNQTNATKVCKDDEFCFLRCPHKPECVPKGACTFEWFSDEEYTRVVIDNRVTIDLDGRCLSVT